MTIPTICRCVRPPPEDVPVLLPLPDEGALTAVLVAAATAAVVAAPGAGPFVGLYRNVATVASAAQPKFVSVTPFSNSRTEVAQVGVSPLQEAKPSMDTKPLLTQESHGRVEREFTQPHWPPPKVQKSVAVEQVYGESPVG
jgi:hypothetical protein